MGDVVRKKWMTMMDIHAGVIEAVYGGPVGLIWEMLAGEEEDCADSTTDILAELAEIGQGKRVLLLLPGPGGPGRCIAERHSCTVVGLVVIPQMVNDAMKKIEKAGLTGQIDFRQGNALDLPFRGETFDTVWGEDTWCYVTDKSQVIREAFRVLKPGGTLALTDWMQIGSMSDDEWHTKETFRIFPYFETIENYAQLLELSGFAVTDREEIPGDPIRQVARIRELLERDRGAIVGLFGEEAYDSSLQALDLWAKAAGRGLISRGWLAARKP